MSTDLVKRFKTSIYLKARFWNSHCFGIVLLIVVHLSVQRTVCEADAIFCYEYLLEIDSLRNRDELNIKLSEIKHNRFNFALHS